MSVMYNKLSDPNSGVDETKLGFGKVFAPFMFLMEYEEGKGWFNPRIVEYQSLSLDPASPVLHYSQTIFEGLKAYRRADGEIMMFRPWENASRLNRSAERLAMPSIEVEKNLEYMYAIVDKVREWVPSTPGTSLYLRPTMIGDGAGLGAVSAKRFLYFILCSPSGSYYDKGIKPVEIWVEEKYVRAVKGGTGEAKAGGNYAGSFRATADAKAKGYDQVLWLDGKENRYIEEVGAMNIFFVIRGKLVTPLLCGSILPGVTRNSILQLGREFGLTCEERRVSIEELIEAHGKGELEEVFGSGTAAVITPVSVLGYKDKRLEINGGATGALSKQFYERLTGIQRGTGTDSYGWTVVVGHDLAKGYS